MKRPWCGISTLLIIQENYSKKVANTLSKVGNRWQCTLQNLIWPTPTLQKPNSSSILLKGFQKRGIWKPRSSWFAHSALKVTITVISEIQDIEINLSCSKFLYESLNCFFYVHNDCFKENFVLNQQDIEKINHSRLVNLAQSKLLKRVSEDRSLIETEDLLEIQFYHPISNFKFIKILKNNLLMKETDTFINYYFEFKETGLLFDLEYLIVPINFFRIAVKLNGFGNISVLM